MLVKSLITSQHVEDLEETFQVLRKYHMRLTLAKCTFGVQSTKFLGLMVSKRGIESNLDKIESVLSMEAPEVSQTFRNSPNGYRPYPNSCPS